MKKVIRTTPNISITVMQGRHDRTGEDTGLYYALRVNGRWENEYNSLSALQTDLLAIIMGEYKYDV